ncbi:MAG: orotidine-5'-phosphate decarboxylase [Thermodesulfobacteriota bacterium]
MEPVSPRDRIIFALDVQTADEAASLAGLLKDDVGVFKIGLELFVASGPGVVKAVRERAPGAGIFLDMKFHDIPATVRGAIKSASALGVDFVTVHCEGGELLRAVVEGSGNRLKVLGVTALTSMGEDDFADAGINPVYRKSVDLVLHRARLARLAGCAGVVCSGLEAGAVKAEFGPDFLVISPGIRSAADAVDDQKRVTTPFEAIRNGADYIVVGRPIRKAPDPRAAAKAIAGQIEKGMQARAREEKEKIKGA